MKQVILNGNVHVIDLQMATDEKLDNNVENALYSIARDLVFAFRKNRYGLIFDKVRKNGQQSSEIIH